jgi:aminoglycoside 2''-phosphotransferase
MASCLKVEDKIPCFFTVKSTITVKRNGDFMINNDMYWHERVHEIMPDLDIHNVELHQEGLVNDVLIVNDQWVFRFTHTEWGRELMHMEEKLMRFLAPRVSLRVPYPEKCSGSVMVYQHLNGDSFLRETWAGKDQLNQQQIADQLGRFLHELHHISTEGLDWEIPLTLAPVTRDTWLDIYDRFIDKVQPLLLPHQIEWADNLFDMALNSPGFFDFDPVLIHGDLAPYHILYSKEQGCLTAVIDFGIAGLGDPATDLGSLISSYGEALVTKLEGKYPELADLMPRARFYAQAIEIQWVLLGVESGEKYWFTAHLGGARDIGYR